MQGSLTNMKTETSILCYVQSYKHFNKLSSGSTISLWGGGGCLGGWPGEIMQVTVGAPTYYLEEFVAENCSALDLSPTLHGMSLLDIPHLSKI